MYIPWHRQPHHSGMFHPDTDALENPFCRILSNICRRCIATRLIGLWNMCMHISDTQSPKGISEPHPCVQYKIGSNKGMQASYGHLKTAKFYLLLRIDVCRTVNTDSTPHVQASRSRRITQKLRSRCNFLSKFDRK